MGLDEVDLHKIWMIRQQRTSLSLLLPTSHPYPLPSGLPPPGICSRDARLCILPRNETDGSSRIVVFVIVVAGGDSGGVFSDVVKAADINGSGGGGGGGGTVTRVNLGDAEKNERDGGVAVVGSGAGGERVAVVGSGGENVERERKGRIIRRIRFRVGRLSLLSLPSRRIWWM